MVIIKIYRTEACASGTTRRENRDYRGKLNARKGWECIKGWATPQSLRNAYSTRINGCGYEVDVFNPRAQVSDL